MVACLLCMVESAERGEEEEEEEEETDRERERERQREDEVQGEIQSWCCCHGNQHHTHIHTQTHQQSPITNSFVSNQHSFTFWREVRLEFIQVWCLIDMLGVTPYQRCLTSIDRRRSETQFSSSFFSCRSYDSKQRLYHLENYPVAEINERHDLNAWAYNLFNCRPECSTCPWKASM